ncbi:hypothetical protein CONPUDRAFT_160180 [Coniophora puteana RWD-64-598 SS2]|uniref:Uncharacterized protein n=1 Tax=Coniophora puteana (strain RWD-64-598) TaxID=741705 RepID=R7SE79_CONPW|nr:uncharacterized protein CONPUDRAFT_160180 [Coniophora puteana RWD-64-598 SS2]EIW74478.1 hypothetical protein CONPUDRAFT_160180 [Coniophora puteana RWD-64-598 SS2]
MDEALASPELRAFMHESGENVSDLFFTDETASSATPFAIASQRILGPTTLVRLLVVLAQRNALDTIQTLRKAPNGLSSATSLAQVQQITHPDVIRRLIKISHKRMAERMEHGRKRSKENKTGHDVNFACTVFMSVAELAAALAALDTHTGGMYTAEIRGARRQIVVALGNAAQMALSLRHYQRSYSLALAAVAAAENIPEEEGLESEVVEKNKRRLHLAGVGLQRR